jgi:hypothetical protein
MMKKPVHIYVCLLLIVLFNGCASTSVKDNSEAKYMLRMLASGAVGNIVAGNFGGFIVGSFIADIVSVAKIEYEDRKLEDRDEASRRLQQKYKQGKENKPEQEKKAQEVKEQEKKAEDRKGFERKAEKQKEREKKAEEKIREQERNAEELKDFDKRVELFIDDATVSPQIAETGSKVEANIRYTVLGPESLNPLKITETRILANSGKSVELAKREISRDQGTYSSTMKFSISEDMPKGYCILYTRISDGVYTKTVKSDVIINK